MRRFAGVDLDHVPDETTICKFRHFLERHRLTAALFWRTEQYLSLRAISRTADVSINTVTKLLVDAG